jgi:hypothetical protein
MIFVRSASVKFVAMIAGEILLLSLFTSCSVLQAIFKSPSPPKAYLSLPSAPPEGVQVAACSDRTKHDIVVPVFVAISNGSQTAWTVDASQISAVNPDTPDQKWLPIPPEEAARMSPVSWMDGIGATIDRAGIFATYGAGLGAAGGAFYSHENDEDVSNGFQIGAAYGALAGLGLGILYEIARLTLSYETKEAGDANEKMKFLALKDRSILYSNYFAVGYVYFSRNIRDSTDSHSSIVIPLIRGDPSKDWVTAPTYLFPEHPDEEKCKDLNKECQKKTMRRNTQKV